MTITNTFSVLLLTFLSLDLQAQLVAFTPANKWLSELNKNLTGLTFEFEKSAALNLPIPNGTISAGEVGLTGRFSLKNLQKDLVQQGLGLDLTIEGAEMLAKNVNVSVTVHQELSFGTATINLNLQCAAISVRTKQAQALHINVSQDFQITNMASTISSSELETSLHGCNNIPGTEALIQQHIVTYLQNQLVNQEVHKALSEEIALQLGRKFNDVSQTYLAEAGTKATMKMDENQNIWVFVSETADSGFTSEELNSIKSSTTTAVLVKKSFLEKNLLQQLNKQIEKTPISSKETKDLEKLTCSRWAQFFVWPALKAFPKCFELKLISRIKELKITDISKLAISVNVDTWAQAPEYKKDIAHLRSKAQVSLLPVGATVESMSGQHFPEFLNWSGRSSRISTSQLESALETYLKVKLQDLSKNKTGEAAVNIFDLKNAKQLNSDTLRLQIK